MDMAGKSGRRASGRASSSWKGGPLDAGTMPLDAASVLAASSVESLGTCLMVGMPVQVDKRHDLTSIVMNAT